MPEPFDAAPWPLARLAPGDADALAALHARCFARPWSAADFRQFSLWPAYLGLAVWHDGAPVGFIVVSMAGTDSDILSFGVDPAFRRRGVASALLAGLLPEIAGIGVETVFLEVETGNEAALALYRRHGFAVTGRRPGYYDTPDGPRDALIMKRTLSGPAAERARPAGPHAG